MKRLGAENGQTLVELLVAMGLMAIVMVGIVNIFVSGGRAGADANARIDAQQNTRLAIDRLEFEGRCAAIATLLNSGAGVKFTIPTQCAHTTTTAVSWCVVSGVLERFAGASCAAGTPQVFIRGVTSATPFSLPTAPSGDLPTLAVALTIDTSRDAGTAATLDDTITLRNATPAS
ncbi:MAG TPA: prepilin-type N-terminal cleavage/methylation domain-containing protein [Gaiellaceae bacterium]|nr:prepilin-type N-terminal cleavage/methylation domain-containing protein [Gaiellaceae bacterium]